MSYKAHCDRCDAARDIVVNYGPLPSNGSLLINQIYSPPATWKTIRVAGDSLDLCEKCYDSLKDWLYDE
jgi:hypothetical protein